jgi:hypothetical protein
MTRGKKKIVKEDEKYIYVDEAQYFTNISGKKILINILFILNENKMIKSKFKINFVVFYI